jgi:Cu(I)/Ag(I) efflux system protein CusF
LTLLAAPLALAACEGGADSSEMPMEGDEMPMAESDAMGQMASATGTLTAIDAEAGRIAIDHGPVEAIGWLAMNMAFKAGDELIGQVEVGDEAAFDFRMSDSGSEITAISKE